MKWLILAIAGGWALNSVAAAMTPEPEVDFDLDVQPPIEPIPDIPRAMKTIYCGTIPLQVTPLADPVAECEALFRAQRIQEERDLGGGWTL